jgi:hypothetical protein
MEIEGFRGRLQRLGDLPGDFNGAVETFCEHWTAVNRHHAMGARGGKTDFEYLVCAAPRMQHGPAAASAMRVDKVADRRMETNPLQRLDNKAALPGSIAVGVPMLHGAATAYAEVRADRRNALRTRGYDLHKTQPACVSSDILNVDGFARQRAWNINRAARGNGDTVAQVAETIDQQPLNHARPRSDIRRCHLHRESGMGWGC